MLVNTHKYLFTLLLLTVVVHILQAQTWTLQQCVDTALINNRSLLIARNQTDIGDQKHREAKANLIPKLTVNADYKYFTDLPTQLMPLSTFNPAAPEGQFKEAQFGVPHNMGATVQLSMPLYNPQVMGAIETTQLAKELTSLQYRKSEEQVWLEVTNLYYTAQIIDYQIHFLDSNIINNQRLVKNIQLLKEQQMAKGTDVNKVQLQLAQLHTQRATAASKYEQVLNALKFTMGISLERPVMIDTRIGYDTQDEYPLNNPIELQIAKMQQKMAAKELSNTRKSRLPTLGLVASYGTAGFGYDKSPNDFLKFFPVGFAGIQLSYPLFTGTVTQHKINQKKVELKNSALQQNMAEEQNKMQIANASSQRAVALQSIGNTTAQIAQADNIYRQTLLQQQQGVASLADVLLADTALREAQQNHLSAVVDYLKADTELKKFTGSLIK